MGSKPFILNNLSAADIWAQDLGFNDHLSYTDDSYFECSGYGHFKENLGVVSMIPTWDNRNNGCSQVTLLEIKQRTFL